MKCVRCYAESGENERCTACVEELARIKRMQETSIAAQEAVIAAQLQAAKPLELTPEEAEDKRIWREGRALYLADAKSAMEHRKWYQEVGHPQMVRATILAGVLEMAGEESNTDPVACALHLADDILAGKTGGK